MIGNSEISPHNDDSEIAREDVIKVHKFLEEINKHGIEVGQMDESELVILFKELSVDFETYIGSEPKRMAVRNRLILEFNYSNDQVEGLVDWS